MRTNLALRNILSNPRKSLLSVAGIGVAILLVFMQLGFRGAIENTATNIYGKMDFDVLLRSPDYLHFIDANQIERRFLEETASMTDVASVNELQVSVVNWRNPRGEMKGILLIGVTPDRSPFRDTRVDQHFDKLTSTTSLLIDRQSHPEFGPQNHRKFGAGDIGRLIEVANQQLTVTGTFNMGAGLAANGAAIVSEKTFEQLVPTTSRHQVTFGLLKLQHGVNADAFAMSLRERFRIEPHERSVEVLTRPEVIQLELDRWIGETPIGFIFTLGVLIALVVGAAIIYMVLGNDVSNRLNEYATLRAMGYSNAYMAAIVLKQAIYLALFSFLPALLLSFLLYWVTGLLANIAMEMNVYRIVFVMLLTLVMSSLSGTLALRKLWQAEPAELF